jgi:hypothetical protein
MKKFFPFFLVFTAVLLSSPLLFGQKLPKEEIRQFFKESTREITSGRPGIREDTPVFTREHMISGIPGMLNWRHSPPLHNCTISPFAKDTLWIGLPPNDSMIITGQYTHNGPVVVIGNGILRFRHANATIAGDLIVWGDHALVTSDSSTLFFPQEYFYQRSLVIAGKGKVIYRNTTLDHSGMSHNLMVTDSGRIEQTNVKNIGFTTCGMYGAGEYHADGIDQAGEFVITDHSQLTFSHAKTILLWHHVPRSGIFHFSFPGGDSVRSYNLSNTTPGISGIDYSVRVDSSTDVMWALMPANGSDVSISDSKIRSIGLWFLGHDTINVSGLVDNSAYSDYTANLDDRNLRLINSSVMTWSLYPMDTVNLNVTGCILGEIGSEYHCKVTTSGAYVDGTGGYWWATGQTLMIAGNCMAVNAIRSDQDAIFIFAYSSLVQGEASSLKNSILMVVQSQLPDIPKLYDGSCTWYSNIGKPSTAVVDTVVQVYGSAWIDKTQSSQLMDFGWYRMYWQKSGDSVWHPIGNKTYTEKRDELLADWNTHGLTPGLYYIKLVLTDNTPDSNQNEAVKGINLLPEIFGVNESGSNGFDMKIFPDPVVENSLVEFFLQSGEKVEISIADLNGKIVSRAEKQFPRGKNSFPLRNFNLPKGCYICILKSRGNCGMRKFVTQ